MGIVDTIIENHYSVYNNKRSIKPAIRLSSHLLFCYTPLATISIATTTTTTTESGENSREKDRDGKGEALLHRGRRGGKRYRVKTIRSNHRWKKAPPELWLKEEEVAVREWWSSSRATRDQRDLTREKTKERRVYDSLPAINVPNLEAGWFRVTETREKTCIHACPLVGRRIASHKVGGYGCPGEQAPRR